MPFHTLSAYLGDNAAQTDATDCETQLRKTYPRLLLPHESILLAFRGRGGKGRDFNLFTNRRILIMDRRGTTGKRIRYFSVPYASVAAFGVETAGSVDADQELKIYARGIGRISMDFVGEVDSLGIHRFLSEMVIRGERAGRESHGATTHDGAVNVAENVDTGFLDVMGSNYSQMSEADIEDQLRGRVLLENEKVEMGFQCGRDSFVLTDKRVLKIDVQGAKGTKVEYLTILWPSIKGFSGEQLHTTHDGVLSAT